MKVSIITINYNNAAVTCEMLHTLEHLDRTDLEVVVVDNGSIESAASIPQAYPWIKFVRSPRNLGFAGGNNLGVAHSTGEYLFFVNNDTAFPRDIAGRLAGILEGNPDVGIVCPVLFYHEAPRRIQYAGFTAIHPLTGRNRCETTVRSEVPYETAYAHGAAMMMPRAVYNQVGPMPENYFVYYEELDWSATVREHGYRILVDPASQIFHKESQTVKKLNEMKSYFMTRNRVLFMRRHMRPLSLAFFWFFFLVLSTPSQLVRYLFTFQWANMKAHLAGIGWHFVHGTEADVIGYKFNFLKKYDAAI